MASLSKLLTALVATSTISGSAKITITADDRRETDGTPGSITRTDTFSATDLYYPLLMESNNSVAYAFARTVGTTTFMNALNAKAQSLGMHWTFMDDPSGISPKNTSSASDLFKLTQYIYENQPYFLALSALPKETIKAQSGRAYAIPNFNHFAGNPEFVGGKSGYTDEAHETMTSVFNVPTSQGTTTIAIIVLNAKDRKADVEKLLAWFKSAAAE